MIKQKLWLMPYFFVHLVHNNLTLLIICHPKLLITINIDYRKDQYHTIYKIKI